jgi:DNA repair photolyase
MVDSRKEDEYTIRMFSTQQAQVDTFQLVSVEADRAIDRPLQACQAGLAVVNTIRGCSFGCLFCPVRRRPNDLHTTYLRSNVTELLEQELARRTRAGVLAAGVIVNSFSDSFQPMEASLALTYEAMRIALSWGLDVHVRTRGVVPDGFGDLFLRYPGKVHVQVSLFSMNAELARLYEPAAATPQQRLDSIRALLRFKVDVQARIEPLIPFISDTAAHLEELVRHLRSVGVTNATSSYLILRPDMLERMHEKLPLAHYQVIKGIFKGQPWRKIGIHQDTRLLSERLRDQGYKRLIAIGSRAGLAINVCACQNPGMGTSCYTPVKNIFSSNNPTGKQQLDLFRGA